MKRIILLPVWLWLSIPPVTAVTINHGAESSGKQVSSYLSSGDEVSEPSSTFEETEKTEEAVSRVAPSLENLTKGNFHDEAISAEGWLATLLEKHMHEQEYQQRELRGEKKCNTEEEKQCRDECIEDEDCMDDDTSCMIQCRKKCCEYEGEEQGDGSEEQEGHDPSPAQDLEFFRNIDADHFEWMDKSEIKDGQLTCGYLKSKLGFLESDMDSYPTVETYWCIKFASTQPAPKGNIVMHCGGPGTKSGCIKGASDIGEENLESYNIITFDQRGVGRSWPSFYHEECTLDFDDNDLGNEAGIRTLLDKKKQLVISCWTCESCDYIMKAEDGSEKEYHFLDFSGTRQVVEDMERFRVLIGAEKLSLYGISYGTQIMSLYATAFPDHVDKFVVDSSINPQGTFYSRGRDYAETFHEKLGYLFFSCSAKEFYNFGREDDVQCPLPKGGDLPKCMANIYNKLDTVRDEGKFSGFEITLFDPSWFGIDPFISSPENVITVFMDILLGQFDPDDSDWADTLVGVCEAANDDSATAEDFYDELVATFSPAPEGLQARSSNDPQVVCSSVQNGVFTEFPEELVDPEELDFLNKELGSWGRGLCLRIHVDDEGGATILGDFFYPSESAPTQDEHLSDIGVDIARMDDNPIFMVRAQDYAGNVYDDNLFIKQWKEIDDLFNGFGTHAPAGRFLLEYVIGFYWPRSHPVPPVGNPTQNGIVAGVLHDVQTPYKWTQEMKQAFPSTIMLTSQWTQHAISTAIVVGGESPCQDYIQDYLKDGTVADDIVDGTTCRSPLATGFNVAGRI